MYPQISPFFTFISFYFCSSFCLFFLDFKWVAIYTLLDGLNNKIKYIYIIFFVNDGELKSTIAIGWLRHWACGLYLCIFIQRIAWTWDIRPNILWFNVNEDLEHICLNNYLPVICIILWIRSRLPSSLDELVSHHSTLLSC